MSYDLSFIYKTKIDLNNVWDILETNVSETDEHYISAELRKQLSHDLQELGRFEVFQSDEHLELTSETCQISIFESAVSLSIPYWDVNESSHVSNEIKEITNLLIDHDFTGFDAQTEQFITEKYVVKDSFTQSKEIVDEGLLPNTDKSHNKKTYTYIGIGFILLVLFIWVRMKK